MDMIQDLVKTPQLPMLIFMMGTTIIAHRSVERRSILRTVYWCSLMICSAVLAAGAGPVTS